MIKTAIIFGGSGYIGRNMLSVFLSKNLFDSYVVCDINGLEGFDEEDKVNYLEVDVREEIVFDVENLEAKESWVFNFAAVHREPGHDFKEYFDTNLPGAENVTDFTRRLGIKNMFFTSSIAPYGKSLEKRTEDSSLYPETAYGISKALCEKIHQVWLSEDEDRRLIIVRPSVIFGPHDPGNVYRMIKAVKKGTFVLPDGGNVIKAYGYIYGLIDSFIFTINKRDKLIVYNYTENPLVPLIGMTKIIKDKFGYKKPVFKVPIRVLAFVAFFLGKFLKILGKTTEIHPVRVRKAGFPTNIEPKYLIDNNFDFKYGFENALEDWNDRAPEDF